ncbi:hypothetical protein [Kitasatospora sp. NPDC057223]|uniref:hypothetical protein n=1 Tax=Kitasatospora sp. NPDC057223 TaxID=3346055 RepID=UPI00364582F3
MKGRGGGERLIAETHGDTSSAATDTTYGQLTAEGERVRYALVVPTHVAPAALGVPRHVRAQLGITV